MRVITRRSHSLSTRCATLAAWLAFVVAGPGSCADEPSVEGGGECYPLDPMLPIDPPSFPHCGWPAGQLPEPPSGFARTNRVGVEFTASDDAPCDPCDTERFDGLLKERIAMECDQPYTAFERGCYRPPDGSDSGPGQRCVVLGIYASNCLP